MKGTSPDVVATIEGKNVGIELTAYHDDKILDSWGDLKKRISEVIKSGVLSPAVRGYLVSYRLKHRDLSGVLKDALSFVAQLSDFTLSCDSAEPFKIGERRSYPSRTRPIDPQPFLRWPLLEQHVDSVLIRKTGVDCAPYFHANLAHYYGTSPDAVAHVLAAKTKQRATNSHKCGIDDCWLLVHADRNPASSAVTQIDQFTVHEILTPQIRAAAQGTGYSRVYLWDCIWGGWIDLVSGEFQEGRFDEEVAT